MSLQQSLSLILAAAGVCSFLLSLSVLGEVRRGVAFMLDLWLAAGLMRLTADLGWEALGSSAVLVLFRKLITTTWSNWQRPQK